MENREQRIYLEAAALWQEVFGEPPPPRADPGAMLDIITANLPMADYDRLRSPHLRSAIITRPGSQDAQL